MLCIFGQMTKVKNGKGGKEKRKKEKEGEGGWAVSKQNN